MNRNAVVAADYIPWMPYLAAAIGLLALLEYWLGPILQHLFR